MSLVPQASPVLPAFLELKDLRDPRVSLALRASLVLLAKWALLDPQESLATQVNPGLKDLRVSPVRRDPPASLDLKDLPVRWERLEWLDPRDPLASLALQVSPDPLVSPVLRVLLALAESLESRERPGRPLLCWQSSESPRRWKR